MKVVSFASFKGGCGKTTALKAICSMLVFLGKKVAIFEADIQNPLQKWRERAIPQGTWDETCKIFISDDMNSFEKAYEEAEEEGFEIVLIDTHGGASELNQSILINSDFIIIPSALTDMDIQSTLDTMLYIVRLFQAENETANTALLWQRFPTSRLTTAERMYLQQLETLDQFEEKLHKRDPFTSIGSSGMLHLTFKNLTENPKLKLKAHNFGVAVNEAEALTKALLEVLGE